MAKSVNAVEVDKDGVYILQSGTPIYVKTADIARIIGKSNQWIGQLTSQGILNKVKTPYGTLYELGNSLKTYIEINVEEVSESEKNTQNEQKKYELMIKKAKATAETLKVKELVGKMYRAEDIAAVTEDMVYAIRNELLTLPGRIAKDIYGADSAAEAAEIIKKGVYDIMQTLATYKFNPDVYAKRIAEREKRTAITTEDDSEN